MAVVNSSKMNFAEIVQQYLYDYREGVYEAMYEAIDSTSKDAVKKLKAESPKGATGDYAKGWTRQLDKGRLTVGATVYGKSGTYQLAHLLEHGHATRKGGRTKEIVHIKPVEEWAVNECEDRILDKLVKGVS